MLISYLKAGIITKKRSSEGSLKLLERIEAIGSSRRVLFEEVSSKTPGQANLAAAGEGNE
jgi:hypothetical protein